MFRINTFAVLYDISTENTNFAAFILHLIFHTNTSFPFCLPSCKTDRLIICYTLSSITEKKAQSLQDNGLNSFSRRMNKILRMTVRWIGGVSFQIKCGANIVCIVITMKTINYFNNNVNN